MIVYLITNTINGMRYIGQTTRSLEKRWYRHTTDSKCQRISRAIRKYGKENFTIETIVEVPTRELLNEFETEYIARYCTLSPNGYNLRLGGQTSSLSEESRRKISQSLIGTKRALGSKHPHTPETKEKIRKSLLGNTRSRGYVHGPERRAKTSEINKKLFSPERMAEIQKLSWSPEGRVKRKQAAEARFLKTVAWG